MRWWCAALFLRSAIAFGATPVSSDVETARAQLPVARSIKGEASAIVAVRPLAVTPDDPHAGRFETQSFTVTGEVSRCFKGALRPPMRVSYKLTSEGRPAELARPHIAFLRRRGAGWVAVDGPKFIDSPPMRADLAQLTPGCRV